MLFERLQELAKKNNVSLQKISEDIGFGINSLYSWKKKNPTSEKLEKVADYFNVSVDYLLGREEKEIKKIDLKYDDFTLSFGGEEITDTERQMISALIETYLKNKIK
ncbi:Helix-turn-helix domain-containing protein [Pilibacter termitis]|jgi:transcriptional regulator with XRE-family HTH domain|uniref:Helix-turn-helix domain-containing protein n=1 Tax=Pilibacter termitis TaxID=263852 RepID=A0A1T4QYS5_9ENTE|nr:helix-turn-helix transcriptional regulator [Pilibacter termitis]SKA08890.1 Helix-turn-helix domain-containing protein [Pilibacter termitis]